MNNLVVNVQAMVVNKTKIDQDTDKILKYIIKEDIG